MLLEIDLLTLSMGVGYPLIITFRSGKLSRFALFGIKISKFTYYGLNFPPTHILSKEEPFYFPKYSLIPITQGFVIVKPMAYLKL